MPALTSVSSNSPASSASNDADRPRARLNAGSLAMLATLLGAFALRAYQLGAGSLWYDETVSAYLAGLDLPAMLAHTAGDIHPPLYYALLHLWTGVAGHSEFALAFLSLAFGLLLVALTQRVAAHLAGPAAGRLAALVAAVSPFAVWYSQEVRMYALGSFLALLSTYSLLRLLQVPAVGTASPGRGSWRTWWVVYVAASAAGIYTLYYFIFVLAFQHVFAATLYLRGRAAKLPWLTARIAIVLLFLPWLPAALRQVLQPPVPPWRGAVQILSSLAEAWTALAAGQSADAATLWPALVGLLVLYALGLWAIGRSSAMSAVSAWLLAAGYTLIPLAAILLISLFTPLYHVRYVFTYSAMVPVALGAGLHQLRRWGRLPVILALVTMFFAWAVSLQVYFTDPSFVADDHRAAVRYLADQWRPGDAVLVNAGYVYPAVLYYYDGPVAWRGRLTTYAAAPADPGAVLLQTGSIGGSPQLGWGSASSDFYATTTEETIAALDRVARLHARLWVYRCYDTVTDPSGAIRQYLDDHYIKLADEGFAGSSYIRVQLYQLRQAGGADVTHLTEGPGELSGVVNLLGSDLIASARSGAPAYVTLYWKALRSVGADLKTFVILRDGTEVVAQWDAAPAGPLLPTSAWKPGAVIRDPRRLDIPVGLPPGEYQLTAGMYSPAGGERLALPGGSTEVRLGMVTIERGPLDLPDAAIPATLHPAADLGGVVELAGANVSTERMSPGETARMTLWWRALREPGDDYTVFAQLLDESGKVWAAVDARPWKGRYPTGRWLKGEVVRDTYDLTLAADAPDGIYRVVAGMYRTADKVRLPLAGLWRSGDMVRLSEIKVEGRQRTFTAPASMQHALGSRLGPSVVLLGYDVEPGQAVTLYWQALGPVGGSYRVFFHVLDAQGGLLGQDDGEPAGGLYPTSGWVKGQVITDRRRLTPDTASPAYQAASFVVGLYEPVTGARLPVYDSTGAPAGDSVRLAP